MNESSFRYKKVGKDKYEYDFMSWDECEKMMNKKERTDMMKEIIDAYKEARKYDDTHLFTDHISWLREGFEKGWFEFPDDYDFDTNRWTIGLLLAQIERYGGIVMETKKGLLPYTDFPMDEHPYYQEKDGEMPDNDERRVGKKLNEFLSE